MKKWAITIAAGVAFVAVGFTAGWWVPHLKAFLEGNHEAVTQLNHLTGLVWRIVGSAAAVVFFIYRLWRPDGKPEDGAKAGGVSVGGQGTTSIYGQVVGRDAIGRDNIGRDRIEVTINEAAPPSTFCALHQLKPPDADFVGREEEIKELLGAMARGGVTISGLTGQGGVGKTALARGTPRISTRGEASR